MLFFSFFRWTHIIYPNKNKNGKQNHLYNNSITCPHSLVRLLFILCAFQLSMWEYRNARQNAHTLNTQSVFGSQFISYRWSCRPLRIILNSIFEKVLIEITKQLVKQTIDCRILFKEARKYCSRTDCHCLFFECLLSDKLATLLFVYNTSPQYARKSMVILG